MIPHRLGGIVMKKSKKMILLIVAVLACWGAMACMAQAAKKTVMLAQVKNVKVQAGTGSTTHKITWKKVSKATGYQVYCKDYSSNSKLYKKTKTVKGASKTTCKITGRKPGKAYAYIVRAYKKSSSGKVTYGKLSGIVYGYSKKKAVKTNTDKEIQKTTETTGTPETEKLADDIIKNPTEKQKYKKVFGDASLKMRYPGGYYTSKSKAEKNMTSITVKTWDFKEGRSGEKYTRTWTIQVHKNLASTVQQIFKEIYEDDEKFPIHELGGYDWRGGHSEHNTGTAIDINWTENYMVNVATGVISCGKYWKPGKDPYSIPKDGVVAKIFKKYGFAQGDWGDSKDYMHFSYFET